MRVFLIIILSILIFLFLWNYITHWFMDFYNFIYCFTILFYLKNAYKKQKVDTFVSTFMLWWSARGSNPWPPACKADALPAELALQLWWPVRDSNPWMYAWKAYVLSHFTNRPYMAATVRIELTTNRLTAGCSTAELCGHISFFLYNNTIKTCKK